MASASKTNVHDDFDEVCERAGGSAPTYMQRMMDVVASELRHLPKHRAPSYRKGEAQTMDLTHPQPLPPSVGGRRMTTERIAADGSARTRTQHLQTSESEDGDGSEDEYSDGYGMGKTAPSLQPRKRAPSAAAAAMGCLYMSSGGVYAGVGKGGAYAGVVKGGGRYGDLSQKSYRGPRPKRPRAVPRKRQECMQELLECRSIMERTADVHDAVLCRMRSLMRVVLDECEEEDECASGEGESPDEWE